VAASGTTPTTDQLTEWIVWADGKVLSYLQVSTLPTDVGNIIKNVVDDLLVRKYRYELRTGFPAPEGEISPAMPELTAQNKQDLDSLGGQSDIEDPAFNFDLDRLEGGYD
jgi:hypothetical protein